MAKGSEKKKETNKRVQAEKKAAKQPNIKKGSSTTDKKKGLFCPANKIGSQKNDVLRVAVSKRVPGWELAQQELERRAALAR